jgi:ABC-type Fe3+-siderophore transport system permease subunit
MSVAAAVQRTRILTIPAVPVILVLALLLAVAVVVSAGVGAVAVPPDHVLAVLLGAGEEIERRIIVEFRLPRIVIAVLAGAALSVSGTILQGVTRNPLASPAVLGINGGAGFAAVVVIFLMPAAPDTAISLAAVVGAAAAGGATYLFSRKDGVVAPVRIALIGIAVGALAIALIQLLIIRFILLGDFQVALRWLVGSLWSRSWTHVAQLLPWAAVLLPAAWLMADRLDVLALGDDVARSLGSRLETLRGLLIALAVGAAASAVAIVGTIAFVGLIAPHVARALVGPRHRALIPAAALLGALLVIVADAAGRTLWAPAEVPAGLLAALIGAPYFLYLLREGGRS